MNIVNKNIKQNNKFPLHLLKCSEKTYVMVECKNGNTFNGTLIQCDKFMNLRLEDVVMTTKDGFNFYKIPEIQIKGSQLKLFRLQEVSLQKAIEDKPKYKNTFQKNKHGKRKQI